MNESTLSYLMSPILVPFQQDMFISFFKHSCILFQNDNEVPFIYFEKSVWQQAFKKIFSLLSSGTENSKFKCYICLSNFKPVLPLYELSDDIAYRNELHIPETKSYLIEKQNLT